ncbi:putative ribonuclease H-like domain-containing protein, partial [Tanacetum coccineum]
TKDETSGVLKFFITGIENLVDHKVKLIRCDNETEFKNREINQFCEMKGILRQFNVARTPQQNGVVERRNMTLIKAARTMLADSKLPTTFWAEAVNTACYVVDQISTKASYNAGQARKETKPVKKYILLPLWTADLPISQNPKSSHDDGSKPSSDVGKKVDEGPRKEKECNDQEKDDNVDSTNNVNVDGTNEINVVGGKTSIELPFDPNMPALEDYSTFDFLRDDEDNGAKADINNLDTTIQVSPILTTRIHKDHPLDQVIRDLQSATQTRRMSKNLEEHRRTQKGNSCIEGSKLDRGYAGRAYTIQVTRSLDFGGFTKWKKGYRYTQEERIDYDEVFAPVARIEAISLFLTYALFKDFVVYQMDVKSAFLYGKIEDEVYVCQAPRFEDPDFHDRVYKLCDDIIFVHNDELCNAFETLMHEKFQMSSMGELTFFLGLQVQQKKDGIFISQDKYVGEILKKFRFTEVKTASTPIETQKPLLKDEDGKEVDVHMYRSMIGSLMYLTSSRPDIMFAVCACARYQVNPKVSHLHAVKRIFRYLKGQPKLGLWYPKDSPFDLVAYTDSDYAGASLDRKSTTGVNAARHNLLLLGYLLLLVEVNAFWAIVKAKTVNGEVQLPALVDGKKIIIIESIVRRDLQLEDAEGVDCLPNATIFKQLTLLGSKTTAWNEFSSTMASAIICLATNQKFNFSKYIFESMVNNLENVSGKF